MDPETTQEIQSDEVQALQGIFFDQFVNCNEEGSEWRPLNVILTVVPQRDQSGPLEAHVQLDLHVIATEDYPNVAPKIILEKPKGLSMKQLTNIENEVEKMAAAKIGQVMIFELYHHIQKFLTEYNKPSFESFYDEMLSRRKEKEMQEAEVQKNEEDIERRLLQIQVDGIKEKRKRNNRNNISSSTDGLLNARRRASSSSIEDDSKVKNTVTANVSDSNSNTVNIPLLDAESRLVKEFEILDHLGKGAFGDVLKVHAKVDGCLYAVKRIKLNLKNKQSNKIMREVQLLRSLNHENIVRYYFSWLENTEPVRKPSQDTATLKIDVKGIERRIPEANNLNLSFRRPDGDPSFSDDNDDEEDDDDDDDDDDWIEFRHQEEDDIDGPSSNDTPAAESTECRVQNQYLYILMEYCERHTLRNAIDNDLYEDEIRVWRLLREVVEGLSYIHQQGIIHRDLKPVNIFLDSEDRVKIGDFGLATGNKQNNLELQMSSVAKNDHVEDAECPEDVSYTGQIGTALYVAPELNTSALKIHYNQKVDLYSLGIIFFEMCYRPFKTEMERHKTLMNLRSDAIVFPNDLYSMKSTGSKKIKLIKALLNHDPMKRPSAVELLDHEYLPPAEVANEKTLESIRHTLCNPQSKIYKHLISECFSQKGSIAVDITFHDGLSPAKIAWQHAFIEIMADNARQVFRIHGGTFLNTPTLSPNNGVSVADGGVVLMTRSGGLVNLPYDVRICFARYLAQNPSVTHLKRYSIDKVFRERRLLDSHPREIFECTFDIVSSRSSHLIMEAETLSIVCEYLDRFSECLHKNCVIRLNHVSLVAAIFFHNHIERKKHVTLSKILSASKFQANCAFLEKRLSGLEIPSSTVTNLINTMNVEISPGKVRTHFEHFMKKSSACSTECKLALDQLEMLVEHFKSLELKCTIVISPNVISNFHHYSGIMFQVVWDRKNKNRMEKDIIATGGRYDNLIASFRKTLKIGTETKQSAVGLTIYMEKLVNILQANCRLFSTIDVLVCSLGQHDSTAEKFEIMKDLWNAGFRCTTLDIEQSLEDTQNYCEKMNIAHILCIKESEPGIARLKSWIKDRYHEKKLSFAEIVPYLKRIRISSHTPDWSIMSSSSNNSNNHLSRSELRSASVSHHESHARKANITFLTEDKMNAGNKRRYENQIMNSISRCLQKITTNVKVEVIAMDIEEEIIKALILSLDMEPKNSNYLPALIKKFPKYKKCLSRLGNCIDELQSGDKMSALVLFNLRDSYFKVIL